MKSTLRVTSVLVLVAFGIYSQNRNISQVFAASTPAVTIDSQKAAPRQVEDTTEKAIARDYSAAWAAMTAALDQNRSELVSANFVGAAAEKLSATIAQQQKAGLHQRFTDQGHSTQVVFYSPEGSAMELRDTARLQIQLLDGDKVIHSEQATVHYIVLLTAAENSWKVRVLQAVPSD